MGKINVYDKIAMKKRKKRKFGNERNLYINLHLKDKFWNGIYSLLMRADAKGSADTIYCM